MNGASACRLVHIPQPLRIPVKCHWAALKAGPKNSQVVAGYTSSVLMKVLFPPMVSNGVLCYQYLIHLPMDWFICTYTSILCYMYTHICKCIYTPRYSYFNVFNSLLSLIPRAQILWYVWNFLNIYFSLQMHQNS